MQIDRLLFPITSLGPGKRLVIWTIGCHKKCFHCANPELRDFDLSKNVTFDQFKKILLSLDKNQIDGITFSGGEPLCQADELIRWIKYCKEFTEDILIFTGYSEEEILLLDDVAKNCVAEAAVTVAGEYIEELNDNTTSLVASSNQKLLWGNVEYQPIYDVYMKKGRMLQNVYYNNNLISVGIHNRGTI